MTQNNERVVEGNVPEYDVNNYKKLLSSTPTQSLAEHDNATIERIASDTRGCY